MQVICILIDQLVREALAALWWGLVIGLALGVVTFDWRGWWGRRPLLAILLPLLLAAPALADPPSVVKDGRTWVWCAPLGMYAPEGAGWQFDADRQVWWRNNAAPAAIQPKWTPPGDGWQWDGTAGAYWRYAPTQPQLQFQPTYGAPPAMMFRGGGRGGSC